MPIDVEVFGVDRRMARGARDRHVTGWRGRRVGDRVVELQRGVLGQRRIRSIVGVSLGTRKVASAQLRKDCARAFESVFGEQRGRIGHLDVGLPGPHAGSCRCQTLWRRQLFGRERLACL